jgi:hypothetical protein
MLHILAMSLKCFLCVLQVHIQYDYYIGNDATLPRPHDTSPTGLLPSTFVLSRWFLPQKRAAIFPTHTAIAAFRTPLAFSHRSSSPVATTSTSSAPGPSPASRTPGSIVGVVPAACLCPHRRSQRRRPPRQLLLWLETMRAS